MPESTPTPTTPPAPAAAPLRAAPGFIDQELEDAIALATACHREAAKADIAPRLTERDWIATEQADLGQSLARCAAHEQRLRETRTGSRTRTDEEESARTQLLTALDPVIKGARRKYPDGSAERRAYGIGARLVNASTKTLLDTTIYAHRQLGPGENNAPPKDVLTTEIAALHTLAELYQNAEWAQADAQKTAAEALSLLRKEVETILNPLRRDLQGAADQAFPHRQPTNAAQRKAFGLQADRSLNV